MQKLQNKSTHKKKINPFFRKCRKVRLVAASATASMLLIASPYAVYAADTDGTVTDTSSDADRQPVSSDDSESSDSDNAEDQGTADIGDAPADTGDQSDSPETNDDEIDSETHIESDSEKELRKIAGDMLGEAKSIKGMVDTYGYTEKTDITDPKELDTGSIVVRNDIYYMVMSYTDTDGNERKELWKEDGSGGFVAMLNFPAAEKCSHEFTLQQKTPDVTLPEGLSGSTEQTLNDVSLPASFSWKAPTTKIAEGENGYEATYTPENYLLYKPKDVIIIVNGKVTVHQMTRPESSYTLDYKKGMKLSELTLPDNWKFENPDADIEPGSHRYTAVFTGDKSLEWSASTDDVSVTVIANKQKIMFDNVTVTAKQGDILTNDVFEARSDGRLEWDVPDQKVSSPGTFVYYAHFIPNDTDTYDPTENIPVSVTVREVKKLTRPSARYTVAYDPDATVSAIKLPANWAFDNPDAKIQLGSHKYHVNFTGDKTSLWSASTDSMDVEIEADRIKVTVPPQTISVPAGAKLTNSMLPPLDEGMLKWKNKDDNAGTEKAVHLAVFTPNDQDRYESAGDVKVTVIPTKEPDNSKGSDKPDKSSDNDSDSKGGSSKGNTGSKDDSRDDSPKSDNSGSKGSSGGNSGSKSSGSGSDDSDVKKPSSSSGGNKGSSGSRTSDADSKGGSNSKSSPAPAPAPSAPAQSRSSDQSGSRSDTGTAVKKAPQQSSNGSTGSDDNNASSNTPAQPNTSAADTKTSKTDSKPNQKDTKNSKEDQKSKKKVKLKNITTDDIIPIISPNSSGKEKKNTNPFLANVEAKPLKDSDKSDDKKKSPLKDIGNVKPVDNNDATKNGTGKDSTDDIGGTGNGDKKSKEKSSGNEFYTPDAVDDSQTTAPSGKNKKKKSAKEKLNDQIKSIKKKVDGKNIILIAGIAVIAVALAAAGGFLYIKKRDGNSNYDDDYYYDDINDDDEDDDDYYGDESDDNDAESDDEDDSDDYYFDDDNNDEDSDQ